MTVNLDLPSAGSPLSVTTRRTFLELTAASTALVLSAGAIAWRTGRGTWVLAPEDA